MDGQILGQKTLFQIGRNMDSTQSGEAIEKDTYPSPPSMDHGDKERASRPNPTNPWTMKEFVKLNLIDRNSVLATDGNSINLGMKSTVGNIVKLESAVVGKLLGKKLPYFLLLHDLKCKWGYVGNFKLILIALD